MPRYGEVDIISMLKDLGVSIQRTLNGETFSTYGLHRVNDEELLTGEGSTIAMRVEIVTIKTSALPVLSPGVPLVIDGNTGYSVVETRIKGDGALTDVYVRKS